MIERLTDAELMQIRERAEKASTGTWVSVKEHGVVTDEEMICFMGVTGNEENDADFVAHARGDVPKLLTEIERLHSGIRLALFDLANEYYTDPNVVEDALYFLLKLTYGGADE